jgi:hypothetical protein
MSSKIRVTFRIQEEAHPVMMMIARGSDFHAVLAKVQSRYPKAGLKTICFNGSVVDMDSMVDNYYDKTGMFTVSSQTPLAIPFSVPGPSVGLLRRTPLKRLPLTRQDKARAQVQKEHVLLSTRMKGFDPKRSRAGRVLEDLYGRTNFASLLSLARICAAYLGLELDRPATRRKAVLLKWFEENWYALEPFCRQRVEILYSREADGAAAAGDEEEDE